MNSQTNPAGLTADVRDLLAAIAEALDLPYPAHDLDAEFTHRNLVEERLAVVRATIGDILTGKADLGIEWEASYLRTRAARRPATYRTLDQAVADLNTARGEQPNQTDGTVELRAAPDLAVAGPGADSGVTSDAPAAEAALTVYRASHDCIQLGPLYATREAARAHCEEVARRDFQDGTLAWVPDHGGADSPEDLVVFGPTGTEEEGPDETYTDYVVTPLTVAAEFAAEADE
ncbi:MULTISPECIES: hypothetical protein [unclassified Streptomyces]|uniref:hypothetical protein n=1 Tax=unclassified Streptomyces TaxID=2593676 RepID=UPI0036E6AB2C